MNQDLRIGAVAGYRGIQLYAYASTGGKYYTSKPMEALVETEEGTFTEPLVSITKEAAQKLMDDLWHCGVRPEAALGSVGQLGAVQQHLQDMRTIAFSKLEVPKP